MLISIWHCDPVAEGPEVPTPAHGRGLIQDKLCILLALALAILCLHVTPWAIFSYTTMPPCY